MIPFYKENTEHTSIIHFPIGQRLIG